MKIPVHVSELEAYLPHRSPMVWVDEIIEVGVDYKGLNGTCKVTLNPEALYVNNGSELRGSAAIEFTAQGFGYLKAAYQELHGFSEPPKETYLTGVRSCNADFSELDISKDTELHVNLSVVREILPLTYVRGVVVEPKTGKTLATAEIQVYVD